MAADRFADGRGRLRGAGGAEGEHRAADGAVGIGVERGDRAAGGVDAVDHDRREGLPGRRFHGVFPSGVDVDEVEQRAHDAVDGGEALGTGAGSGLIERQAQRLRPRRPRVPVRIGGAQRGLRVGDLLLGARPLGLGARQLVHERGLRRLRRLRLGPQPGGLGIEPRELLLEGGQPGRRSMQLLAATVDARAQGRQLAAALGGSTREGGDAVGPVALEGDPSLLERTLGPRELVALRREGGRLGIGVGQLGPEAGGLGFERGDHGLVDEGPPLAVDPAAPLSQHRGQAARLLAERLEPHQRVAEVVAAGVTQLGFGGEDRGVELGEGSAQEVVLGGQLGSSRRAVGEAPREGRELSPGQEHLEGAQLGDEIAVAPGGVRLPLERSELTAHLPEEVAEAGEVALGRGEAALGLLLALAVLQDPGRFLEDQPAVFRAGVEHGVDLALADDDVLLPPHAGVRQEVLDVEQPARHAVDGVLAVTRAEQRAGERDLGELDR